MKITGPITTPRSRETAPVKPKAKQPHLPQADGRVSVFMASVGALQIQGDRVQLQAKGLEQAGKRLVDLMEIHAETQEQLEAELERISDLGHWSHILSGVQFVVQAATGLSVGGWMAPLLVGSALLSAAHQLAAYSGWYGEGEEGEATESIMYTVTALTAIGTALMGGSSEVWRLLTEQGAMAQMAMGAAQGGVGFRKAMLQGNAAEFEAKEAEESHGLRRHNLEQEGGQQQVGLSLTEVEQLFRKLALRLFNETRVNKKIAQMARR